MGTLRWTILVSALGLAIAPTGAFAQDTLELETADDDEWNERWPRFRAWEAAASTALMAEAFTVRFALDWDRDVTWRSGILFDDWAQEHLTVDDDDAYRTWVHLGDVPFYASLAWPVLDPLTVAATTGDWDAPVQMLAMNFEAFAFFSAALWTSQYFVRRERPMSTELCASDPQRAAALDISCGDVDAGRSFLGGHVGVVVTNTALTCLHHTQMDLYGSAGDGLVCGAWIAASGLTFASRTATGKHYLTDNIFGVGLGLVSGLAIPYLLHYAHDHMLLEDLEEPAPRAQGPRLLGVGVTPNPTDRGLEITAVGTL